MQYALLADAASAMPHHRELGGELDGTVRFPLTDPPEFLQTLAAAPGADPFVGPDQAALEQLLASFEPVPTAAEQPSH